MAAGVGDPVLGLRLARVCGARRETAKTSEEERVSSPRPCWEKREGGRRAGEWERGETSQQKVPALEPLKSSDSARRRKSQEQNRQQFFPTRSFSLPTKERRVFFFLFLDGITIETHKSLQPGDAARGVFWGAEFGSRGEWSLSSSVPPRLTGLARLAGEEKPPWSGGALGGGPAERGDLGRGTCRTLG